MKKYIIAVLCACTALTSYAVTPKRLPKVKGEIPSNVTAADLTKIQAAVRKALSPKKHSSPLKTGTSPLQLAQQAVKDGQTQLSKVQKVLNADPSEYASGRHPFKNWAYKQNPGSYQFVYDGLSFAQKMLEEVEEQIAQEKWVSNVEAEVTLGRILEVQEAYREAATHMGYPYYGSVPQSQSNIIRGVDTALSYLRYYYLALLGVDSALPGETLAGTIIYPRDAFKDWAPKKRNTRGRIFSQPKEWWTREVPRYNPLVSEEMQVFKEKTQEAQELLALIEKIDTLSPAEEERLTELLNKNEENLKAVSSAEMSLAKEESSLQATQINLPRKNPSFEGMPVEEFATLAKDILKETKTKIDDEYKYAIFRNNSYVDVELRGNYRTIYQNSWSVLKQMSEEIGLLVEQGTALSPAAAEVQLGKILETQTMLRTFAAKYLDKWSAPTILTLDYFLSQYRYLYATSADIFAAMPADINRPYFSDNINNILEKLKTRYRNNNPMISLKEFNSRRSSKQPEEDAQRGSEKSKED